MNRKTKKRIAAILTIAVMCNSIGLIGSPLNTKLDNNSFVYAANEGMRSGNTDGKYYVSDFENGYTLYYVPNKENKTVLIEGCITYQNSVSVVLPYNVNFDNTEYTVVGISDNAFKGQNSLKEICGGIYLKTVGNSAFEGCTNLESIINFEDLEEIGNSAFLNCSNIFKTNTFYLGSLKKLGERAFMNSSIYGINMSSSQISAIPSEAFSGCENLSYAKLPEKGVTIKNEAFTNCTSLDYIYIPDSFKFIRKRAFKNDKVLKTVLMPSNLQEIGDEAFMGCDSMEYIVFKNPYTTFSGIYNAGWRNLNKKNKNFVVWGNGSWNTAAAFASRNGFTYKDINNASLENVLDDNNTFNPNIINNIWSLPNYFLFWGKNLGDGKYNYMDNNKSFDGICYGMSSVSVLSQNGYFDINNYRNELELNKYTNNSEKITLNSLVPYNQTDLFSDKCKLFVTKCQRLSFGAADITMDNSNELVKYAEYVTYGADKAVISISQWQHAVVCEGLEYKEIKSEYSDYWDENCSEYDARILVYDVNIKAFDDSHCIYINTSNGDWFIPCTDIQDHCNGLKFKFRPSTILHDISIKTPEDTSNYIDDLINSIN